MQDPVDHRVGEGHVPEHLAPMVEALVAREYRRSFLVSHRYELEQQVRILPIYRKEPDLVDDEQRVRIIELQPLGQR